MTTLEHLKAYEALKRAATRLERMEANAAWLTKEHEELLNDWSILKKLMDKEFKLAYKEK